MISFENDYSETTNDEVLEALKKAKNEQNAGYGLDKHSKNAAKLIKELIKHKDVDVHFIQGGTPCNVLVMELLRPYEAIISVVSGHINTHETGAVEHFGHKILVAKDKEGKLIPDEIDRIVKEHLDEHQVKPKLVFISNATEYGTTYSKEELKEIRKRCDKYGLYLYLDGARLGNAIVLTNLTFKDIADVTDLFYIGGTKNGALLGEALIIKNNKFKKEFRFLIKQNLCMLAKGFVNGIQFETLLKNDLYLKNAKHANDMADLIRAALKKKNIKFLYETKTNQIFPILTHTQYAKLSKEFIFLKWSDYNDKTIVIRLVTSWNTKIENINKLISSINNI